jgi:hypothetical protein
MGLRKARSDCRRRGLLVIVDYLVTDVDAFVADIDTGSSYKLSDVILRLTAKGAGQ